MRMVDMLFPVEQLCPTALLRLDDTEARRMVSDGLYPLDDFLFDVEACVWDAIKELLETKRNVE